VKSNSYRCDNCDKSREKDANHWLLLRTGPLGIFACIRKWDQEGQEVAERTNTVHACGQECAFAMLTRFLATGSFKRASAARKEESCRSSD
jgi:hypothetical protein